MGAECCKDACVCLLCSQSMEMPHTQLVDIKQFSKSVLAQETVYQAVYLSRCDLLEKVPKP